jgi:peptidoglycan/LPS O-acetylase OafA/YrhL
MSIQTSISSKPDFREATNLLRGICAFSVLLWHYQHFLWNSSDHQYEVTRQPFYKIFQIPYTMGSIGVPIFWCISGLILTHSYQNSYPPTLQKFAISRLSRLYPLHLVTLFAVAVLQQVSLHTQGKFEIYGHNDFYHFVLNIFFVQSWGLERGRSFNAPSWSVSTEIIVYLIFLYLIKFLNRYKLIGSFLLFLISAIYSNSVTPLSNFIFFKDCLTYFLLGVFIFYLSDLKLRLVPIVGSFFSLCLVIWASTESQKSDLLLIGSLVAMFAFMDLTSFKKIFKPLRLLGELSFSIFLIHIPLQILIKLILLRFEIDRSSAYENTFFVFFITLTYLVGYLSYKHIEQPAQRYLRQKLIRA